MRGSESRVPWSAGAHSAPCRPPRRYGERRDITAQVETGSSSSPQRACRLSRPRRPTRRRVRSWGAHTNHYISDKFQTVANSEGESVQRLEEAVATLGGVSDRELMERARLLVQSPGFVPRSPDGSVVTAFVMLADIELGSVQTAPGGGGRGPWVRVSLP